MYKRDFVKRVRVSQTDLYPDDYWDQYDYSDDEEYQESVSLKGGKKTHETVKRGWARPFRPSVSFILSLGAVGVNSIVLLAAALVHFFQNQSSFQPVSYSGSLPHYMELFLSLESVIVMSVLSFLNFLYVTVTIIRGRPTRSIFYMITHLIYVSLTMNLSLFLACLYLSSPEYAISKTNLTILTGGLILLNALQMFQLSPKTFTRRKKAVMFTSSASALVLGVWIVLEISTTNCFSGLSTDFAVLVLLGCVIIFAGCVGMGYQVHTFVYPPSLKYLSLVFSTDILCGISLAIWSVWCLVHAASDFPESASSFIEVYLGAVTTCAQLEYRSFGILSTLASASLLLSGAVSKKMEWEVAL